MRVRGSTRLGAATGPELHLAEAAALGRDAGLSPLELLEESRALLEMDRAGVGTPLGDLGTSELRTDGAPVAESP